MAVAITSTPGYVKSIPGQLNITIKKADDFSTSLDFSTSAVGATVTSDIVSAVTGMAVAPFTTSVVDAESGQVSISLTSMQSSGLASGTYRWQHVWDYPGDSQRTMLTGFVEVLP